MTIKLHRVDPQVVDGENTPVMLDVLYAIQHEPPHQVVEAIKAQHGDDIYLVPLSGLSAGDGVYQTPKPAAGTVVGLRFLAVGQPRISLAATADITRVAADEIRIDAHSRDVCAGSCITLEQLNLALADQLGAQFKVLGADLTSYTYAQVGATFMTGGMGPQRRYFSDSVREIALYDGATTRALQSPELTAYAGTYGWSGLVAAVRCGFVELPQNEIAFVIPVNSDATELARLLHHFAPYTYLQVRDGKLTCARGGSNLALGLEHVTAVSMQPLLAGDNATAKEAGKLAEKCRLAGADGLIFVNGYSNLPTDEFLMSIVDDADAEQITIAGIDLQHTEIFNRPDDMRRLREAVAFSARMQTSGHRFIYKSHTDANIRLARPDLQPSMEKLWQAHRRYVDAVQDHFSATPAVTGQMLVYGHLNPVGVDPHNRIVFVCDDAADYQHSAAFIRACYHRLLRELQSLCAASQAVFIGGEKSAGSEYSLFAAFDGPQNAPPMVAERFRQQARVIRNAPRMFNWRAKAPYVEAA